MVETKPNGNEGFLETRHAQALSYVTEARKCRRHRRRAAQLTGVSTVALFTLFGVTAALPNAMSPAIAEALIFLFITVAGGGIMWYLAISGYLGEIVRKSESSGDKSRIGVVIDTYTTLTGIEDLPFRDEKRSASLVPLIDATANTIANILSTFDETDIGNLLPEHHITLHKLIMHHDPRVANGVLAGLGAVGNEGDLQFILSLIGSPSALTSGSEAQLKASITQLETRLQKQQQAAELLRPGTTPGTTPEQLLRPVNGQQENQEKEQLLRAGME